MTEDEQEALSFRYIMPRIMRLRSGNYAIFLDDGLIIRPQEYILPNIPSSDQIEAYHETLRARRPKPQGPLKTLNLADLGL